MISIPIPEKVSTNDIYRGMHWSKRKRLADEFHEALIEYRLVRFSLPASLLFTFTFKGKLLDCSNCTFMAKMLEDAMVQWKIIPDDTPDYVRRISIQVMRGTKDIVTISAQ
jgi:hypothetical protein